MMEEPLPAPATIKAPATPSKTVAFKMSAGVSEREREKFLTAKYGAHQMALIRKRLRVEMWMYERLHELYGAVSQQLNLTLEYRVTVVVTDLGWVELIWDVPPSCLGSRQLL